MGQVRDQLGFAATLYREKARFNFNGYVRRDPLCLTNLSPGRRDPYPFYEKIRLAGPLSRSRFGVWTSADYDVINSVLRSRKMSSGPPEGQRAMDLSLLEIDPPDHTRLRRFVMPSFSPRKIKEFDATITTIANALLDDVSADEPFDLVSTLAAPLPIAVIADLLGVPDADNAAFSRYGAVFGSAIGGVKSLRHARDLLAARTALADIFTELFERKRREPGDDLITRAVDAGPEVIRPDELVPLCTLLLIAGFETTVNLIGNTVLALLDHPDQWLALCDDPGLAARAVEETLRWDPPVQRTGRTAKEAMIIGGQEIAAGDMIVVALAGANRDPGVFPRPAEFDLTREDPAEHLAFSGGIHYCVGAPLARLEATVAVRTLAERLPDLTRSGEVTRRDSTLIRGLSHFPLRTGARATTGAVAA